MAHSPGSLITAKRIDIDRWTTQAAKYLEDDGDYAYESLAVAMALEIGPGDLWAFAGHIELYVHGLTATASDDDLLGSQAGKLYDVLGWTQAALFAAWAQNIDNYREVRDLKRDAV